jgi:CheY-like chemotaxis protein
MERLRNRRVLLAEDHAINRDLAVEILMAAGVQVDVAMNGREAVEKAIAGRWDAVLMDIHMPELDGYQATTRIRAAPGTAALPIIAMTADADPADRERALAAGMNDHLSKPVDVHALFAKLARWIDQAPGDEQETTGSPAAAATPPMLPTSRRSMLTRFCEEFQGFAESFADALAAPHSDACLRLAHALKGVAGNLGLMEVARRADALELACRAGEAEPALAALAAQIDAQITALAESTDRLPTAKTEPPPCCEVPALSKELAAVCQAMAARLQALLDGGDAEALEVSEQLATAMGHESGLGRRLAALSRRVQAFEFADAALDLRTLEEPIARLGEVAGTADAGPHATTALMDRLAALLEGDDTTAAVAAADLLRAVGARTRPAAAARRIAQCIDEFDYTGARTALEELRQQQAQENAGDRGATNRPDR